MSANQFFPSLHSWEDTHGHPNLPRLISGLIFSSQIFISYLLFSFDKLGDFLHGESWLQSKPTRYGSQQSRRLQTFSQGDRDAPAHTCIYTAQLQHNIYACAHIQHRHACTHTHTHTHNTHTYKRAHTHSLPWLFPLRKNVNARWEWSTTLFWLPETLTQEKPVCPQRVPMSGNQPVLPGAIICLNDSSTASCQPLSRGHRLEVT